MKKRKILLEILLAVALFLYLYSGSFERPGVVPVFKPEHSVQHPSIYDNEALERPLNPNITP